MASPGEKADLGIATAARLVLLLTIVPLFDPR
jgi:hypothetical protein